MVYIFFRIHGRQAHRHWNCHGAFVIRETVYAQRYRALLRGLDESVRNTKEPRIVRHESLVRQRYLLKKKEIANNFLFIIYSLFIFVSNSFLYVQLLMWKLWRIKISACVLT